MKKTKLILAMYIGVITLAVASVSMSVAWFATSRTLYVNSINITIDTDRDLKISTEKEDGYVEHIDQTEDDVKGVFIPLTTAHSSTWTSQKLDSPIFYDESGSSEVEHYTTYAASDNGYYSRKFYLLGDDDLWITIDPSKTYISISEKDDEHNAKYAEDLHKYYASMNDEHYEKYKQYSEDELHELLNNVVKAMRFSILIKDVDEYSYTIIDPHYEEETLMGGLLDNSVDDYYDYYVKENTDERFERVYGEYSGEIVYDEPLAQDSEFKDPDEPASAFNARHKEGVKPVNFQKSKEEKGFEFKKEGAINLEDFNSGVPFHFPVYMDKPKEVVISLYIEGWDLDSVNYTMGAAFSAGLGFKIEREM